jgi:cellulose biosynthesis protein BcsQ
MSKIYDALREAQAFRSGQLSTDDRDAWEGDRDFRVVSVTSNKGGVGKTTIATNLAVYARALREETPVLLLGFDDQTTLDRMFALEPPSSLDAMRDAMATALSDGSFERWVRFGQYGVEYVPSSRNVADLKRRLESSQQLRQVLLRSGRRGLVLIDTKSDFEILTQAAIDASDLVIVVVKDQASLIEARRVFDHLSARGRPPATARILLSLVDLRVKYREDEETDVLAHLLSEIRREGYPLFETFVSRSPKVESLHTNPSGRVLSILHGADGSIVQRQMRGLAEEVLRAVAGA